MDNIQSQIDSAASQGGGDVILPPVRFKPSQIVVRAGVNLIGQGRVIYDWPNSRISGGTIFEIDWGSGPGSSGDPTKAAVLTNTASGIRNVAFDYPAQLPGLAAPIEYGSSIQLFDSGAPLIGVSITDIYGFKPYILVDARGSVSKAFVKDLVIDRIGGCPLHTGIAIDYVADWQDLANIKFNSGDICQPQLDTSPLVAWVRNNGKVLELGGNDWVQSTNVQAWGYNIGAHIIGGQGYAGSGPYTLENCQFDGTWIGVYLDGHINHSVKIEGCDFSAYGDATKGGGFAISAAPGLDMSAGGLQVLGNYAFGPTRFFVWLGQGKAGNALIAGNYTSVNPATDSAVTFTSGGDVHVTGNIFKGFAGTTDLNGVGRPIIANNQH